MQETKKRLCKPNKNKHTQIETRGEERGDERGDDGGEERGEGDKEARRDAPPLPRQLHKTRSLFMRGIPPSICKKEIVNVSLHTLTHTHTHTHTHRPFTL